MKKSQFPVYLINLAHDHLRREESMEQLHGVNVSPHLITAYNGHQKNFPFHQYVHLSRGKWWDKNIFKPGAFACYLSHAKCWEQIVQGDDPYGLVLEDDMIINTQAFNAFHINDKISDFDIIFVNVGVTRLLNLVSFKEDILKNDFISFNEVLMDLLVHHKFNDDLTPGAYGYFVSKKGANKLLQIMEREKVCMGVDYAMIFSSLSSKNIQNIHKLNTIPNYLQIYLDNLHSDRLSSNDERIGLESYIYTSPPLVFHKDNGVSSLKHEIYENFSIFDTRVLTKKEKVLYDLFKFDTGDVDYLVNISNKYKYIYFETPKVGCSTIKKTLQKLEVDDVSKIPEDVHEKYLSPLLSPLQLKKDFTDYLNSEYFKFSFVRNPYTRILSCYLDKILGSQKEIILPQLGFKPIDKVSFKEFLLAVKNQSYAEMNVHWKPQSVLLAAENITLDFIGRQENFDNDLKKVLAKITKQDFESLTILNEVPHSVGASKKLQKYLDEDTIKLIQEVYHNDFLLYGYSKDPFYAHNLSSLSTLFRDKGDTLDENSLVSIVIPCYNQAEYLEEAVESAVNQTYSNIEIIIVNDGSTDNTQQVASALQKRHPEKIKVINQDNSGVSQARNRGIKQACGQYIVPLDADDKLKKQMISQCMSKLIKNKVDIIYGDLKRFGDDDSIRPRSPFSENTILYQSNQSVTSLYRKEVWVRVNGYKQNMYEGFEDWEFWVNAYKNNFKFLYLPEILFFYRIKKTSRDTLAEKQTPYLHAKIIMNHPELYILLKVENAISIIKDTEKLADLYFSYSKEIIIDEQALLSSISNYLEDHTLEDKQIVNISFDQQIGLCALDVLENAEDLDQLMAELGINLIVFYSAMRYEIPLLKNCTLAWSKSRGIETVHGTCFPFTSKTKRENTQLQDIAHVRLRKYQEKVLSVKMTYLKKENHKLISIVIPCYNQGEYLEETVESVVTQTYENIEIIIVNDGSTDESENIAQKLSEYYPDKNIRLVNQVNKGLSEARNSGIKEALGDYLFLLDADDKIHHNTLRCCMNAMVKENADIVYGDYQHFGEKSTIQKTRGKVDLYFIQYTNITGATALYKKSVWEKTGGYKQNMDGGYEDWELWVNATKKGFKFHHISKVLFYYRVKKESMYTDAVKKHAYLCSKVVMNHPELYTESQQNEAVKSIQSFENTPDFFFYFDRDIFTDEKGFMLQIEEHLKKNDFYEKLQSEKISIITSLESFGTIALCSLHTIKDAEQLREVAMKSNADHIVVYSKLKHSTDTLDIGTVERSRFAFSRQKGCVPAKGTLFPLLDTNENLKTEAYKRSEQYLTERCQKLEMRLQNDKYLDKNNIDNIRDAAMVLEKTNIELAYKLMSIAYDARPKGPRIIKKLSDYRSLLDINDESVHKIEKQE